MEGAKVHIKNCKSGITGEPRTEFRDTFGRSRMLHWNSLLGNGYDPLERWRQVVPSKSSARRIGAGDRVDGPTCRAPTEICHDEKGIQRAMRKGPKRKREHTDGSRKANCQGTNKSPRQQRRHLGAARKRRKMQLLGTIGPHMKQMPLHRSTALYRLKTTISSRTRRFAATR